MRCLYLLLLPFLLSPSRAIHREYLYPHGRGVPDKILPPQDDVSSPELYLQTPIVFYDEVYSSIYVNSNGLLSFSTEVPKFYNLQFPLDYPVIAPLYSNVDVRASGAIYYRETEDSAVLERATRTIRGAFSKANGFTAKSALIVTWEDVGYHKQGADKVNTFQAVVISDGDDSYVELLYPDQGIQWVHGTGQVGGLLDALAQAGFISADGRVFTLKGSGTDQVRNLNEWSNADNPGQWIFHVGKLGSRGNVEEPDTISSEEDESTAFCSSGFRTCHSRATCTDYEHGFCCNCQDGFFGNGKNCLSEAIPIRVNGKLSGNVNGETLHDLDLQAYVVPADGRIYTAISIVQPTVGYDMQSLNVLGSTIGWLFARPVKGALNGYQLTGGVFNQTVTLRFPHTGDQLNLTQRFTGLDVFQQLTMVGELRGTVPVIPLGSKIAIKDFEEQYTRVGLGQLIAESSQIYQLQGASIDNKYRVEQTINFDECPGTVPAANTMRLKVVRNFIGYEQKEEIIRFAMNNKIIPLGVDEDPCRDAAGRCGLHSTCIVEGSSFRCACNPGFIQSYGGDGSQVVCSDIDECATGLSNCPRDATCTNTQGSFHCQCDPGFRSEGDLCISTKTCEDRCDANAECVHRSHGVPRCVCKHGYYGNGTLCISSEPEPYPYPYPEETQPQRPPQTHQEQHPPSHHEERPPSHNEQYPSHHGQHSPSQHEQDSGRSSAINPICEATSCRCPEGYDLDYSETVCYLRRNDQDKTSNEENAYDEHERGFVDETLDYEDLQHPEPICLDTKTCSCPKGYKYISTSKRCEAYSTNLFTKGPTGRSRECIVDGLRCHPQASCIMYAKTRTVTCECKPGYRGDGVTYCDANDGYGQSVDDECLTEADCVGDADCVTDHSGYRKVCLCHHGYTKNPVTNTCHRTNEAPETPRTCGEARACHPDARCVDDNSPHIDCKCNPGFEGDGFNCKEISVGCNVLFDCAPTADCLYDENAHGYRCKCRSDHQGDGHYCTPTRTCRDDPSLCGERAVCLPSRDGSYSCQCAQGYVGNGQICKPESSRKETFLLVSQGMAILKVPLQQTTSHRGRPIMLPPLQQAIGIDIDCEEDRVYWSDISGHKIFSSDYTGQDVKTIVDNDVKSAEGLSVDWTSQNIFWTDSDKDTIEVANLKDPSLRKVIVSSGLVNPRGIAIHPSRGKVFWADWNRASPRIEWVNMDGSDRQIFLQGPRVKLPNSLAIDFDTDELCWADAGTFSVDCIGIGNHYERTIAANLSYPFGLSISQDHYYWTDWISHKIERATRPGQVLEKPLLPPLGSSGKLYGIVAIPDSCPRISNVCQRDKGRCPEHHLCLLNGQGGRSCVCASPICAHLGK